MKVAATLVCGVLLLLAGQVQAARDKGPFRIDPAQPLAAQLAKVPGLLSDKAYAEISVSDRRALRQALDELQKVADATASNKPIVDDETADVATHIDTINQALVRAHADSRVTCTREMGTGSRFGAKVCRTEAQRRVSAEAGRDMLRHGQLPEANPDAGPRQGVDF